MTLTAPTKLTVSASGGVDLGVTHVYGFETGHQTVSGTAVTLNAMGGTVVSATNNLANGATETWTLTNSRVSTSSVVVVSMHTNCNGGYVLVVGATPAAGSA